MYTAHFGLNAAPFSITPDPHYLYLSNRHREALAHLLYGVNEGSGFVLLTGEVGTGKTTLCRSLIEQLPDTVDVALLLNPRVSPQELLATLFDELRIDYDPHQCTPKDFFDKLSCYLLTAHVVKRRTVLILDEAQNLTSDVLEQVRLLTNLETSNQKLLQIILVGQPELKKIIKHNNLRQLAQRITARYHLLPLSAKDTRAYIKHRLAVSGNEKPLFAKAAVRLIYRYSGGIPRLINILCDRALLGGYVKNKILVDTKIVQKAVQEVRGENIAQQRLSYPSWWLLLTFLVVLLAGVLSWWQPNLSFLKDLAISYSELFLPQSTENNFPEPIVVSELEIPGQPVPSVELSVPTPLQLPPSPPDLSSLLPKTTTESAFTSLFKLWDLDYSSLSGDKACQRASTKGLTCLLRTGTWKDIHRFNRPTVIELVSVSGTQYHLVVTHLQGDIATLVIAGQMYEFPISKINEFWLGQFLLLWQPPTLPIHAIQMGVTSDAVVWMRRHLDIIEGLRSEPHTLSSRFDYALKKRVIAFQRQQKLEPDGVVGEQTMLVLQALAGQGPLLR
jgi:general secretion pathway protein A